MKFGRLWCDSDSNKTLEQKITDAVNNYYEKQEVYPNAAYVHPSMLKDTNLTIVGNVAVYPAEHVQPNNVWVGWEE